MHRAPRVDGGAMRVGTSPAKPGKRHQVRSCGGTRAAGERDQVLERLESLRAIVPVFAQELARVKREAARLRRGEPTARGGDPQATARRGLPREAGRRRPARRLQGAEPRPLGRGARRSDRAPAVGPRPHASWTASASVAVTSVGSLAVTVVPAPSPERISSSPPSSATRSRIPSSPKPSLRAAGSKPRPSSRTTQLDRARRPRDLDHRALGVPVLDGVGERLLDDPVERRLELAGQRVGAALLGAELDADVDLDAVPRACVRRALRSRP